MSRFSKKIFQLLLLLLFVVSCMPTPQGRTASSTDSQEAAAPGGTGSSVGGDGSISSTNPMDNVEDYEIVEKVEIRHFVDPFDESYKPKITIPKNFTGFLYLAGLNISSLRDKFVKVRFNFGQSYEPVTIDAVVGKPGPGVTPQTTIEVLILELKDHPFSNIRLSYDLFDYNDYGEYKLNTTTGEMEYDENVKNNADIEIVSDPRNVNLYCRGLHLIDDPSFDTGSSCNLSNSKCLYTYAKIIDNGFETNEDPEIPGVAYDGSHELSPTYQHVALNSEGTFSTEQKAFNAAKCLPDSKSEGLFETLFSALLSDPDSDEVDTTISFGDQLYRNKTSGIYYKHHGPYRPINTTKWLIQSDAVYSQYGIYPPGKRMDSNAFFYYGYQSLMFPRAGKMDLNQDVEYLGSVNPLDERSLQKLSADGSSLWMDGCNIRVSNYYAETNEGISSCNVTATIEILAKDPVTQVEDVVSVNRDIKLQLIRESDEDYYGRQVLYSAMKKCANNNACGGSECCYNERCWSKDLVAACFDDSTGYGDIGVGEVCTSDYQCQSLCCNTSTGKCSVHDATQDPPVYCGKWPGQQCVAKEWCQKQSMSRCFIVQTGTTYTGMTCAMRCYNVLTFPNCTNGVCIPQIPAAMPIFDPANPDCTDAMTTEEVDAILIGS